MTSAAGRNKKRLVVVLLLTGAYLIAEVIGGYVTGSLALLADAGHMLTDVGGLGLALLAINFAERPATPERTYGYHRVEILAAVANAVILLGVSFYVLFEAYQRLRHPPEVQSGPMLVVAVVGLIVNLVGMRLLASASEESLNMKGAYFEVLSDLLTSVGVIVAALVMMKTGWYWADPLISAGIGLFIFPRTWVLLRDAVAVLLEGVPSGVNLAALREALRAVDGVQDVHDLHAWSLTSGVNAMSAHVVMSPGFSGEDVLIRARQAALSSFPISHVTVQVEPAGFAELETHL